MQIKKYIFLQYQYIFDKYKISCVDIDIVSNFKVNFF